MKLAWKEPLTDKVDNGKLQVPAILHEPMAIDKSNVDSTIIKDGYHTREDIYTAQPAN